MTGYLIRRAATALVVLLGVSVFIFLMLHLIFPSPAIDVLGPHANKFSINQWNAQHGFDEPWLVQYLRYLNQLLHGNLGYSYKLNQSVAALFQERWLRSAYLSGVTLFLSVVIAIPLGIYQAVRRNTLGDSVVTTGAFVTYAMPDFFLYLIAIQLFAITIPIFSYEASQTTSMWSIITDWRAMTLPIVCLTLLELAGYSRYMRSSAIDTLAQDYIKAARAKGLPGAAGPVAAPGPQRLPADDHPDRPVDPGAAGRQPDLRGGLQLPRPRPAVLQQPGQRRLPGPARLHAGGRGPDGRGELHRRYRPDRRRPADPARLTGPCPQEDDP